MKEQRAAERIVLAMSRVEEVIQRVLGEAGAARPAIDHLVMSGGKRLRPLLAILGASVVNEEFPDAVIEVAAAAELVHTASLLHDDVVDNSDLRRNKPTARLVYSNAISVLSGDHCLASAFKLIHQANHSQVLTESLDMICDLSNGELIQIAAQGKLDTPQEVYEDICYRKTAALFVWASRAGASLAGGSESVVEALEVMGRSMGIAFQVADDLLDFTADQSFGKDRLDDLIDGRLTLPMIVALQREEKLAQLLQQVFSSETIPSEPLLATIHQTIIASGAVEVVQERVNELTNLALEAVRSLPDNPYREMIEEHVTQLAHRKR